MRVLLCLLFSFATLLSSPAGPDSQPEQIPKPRVIVITDRGPHDIPYQKELTVMGAIGKAGGFTDFAKRPLFLIRSGQAKKLDVMQDKNIPLEAWDIVVLEQPPVVRF